STANAFTFKRGPRSLRDSLRNTNRSVQALHDRSTSGCDKNADSRNKIGREYHKDSSTPGSARGTEVAEGTCILVISRVPRINATDYCSRAATGSAAKPRY